MSTAEMVAAAKRTGLKGSALTEAIAISMAEDTSRRIDATNHNSDGSIDRGYWQINSIHSQYDPRLLLTDAD